MPREASNSPGARALRRAGYLKLPAWWVTEEQMQLITYMAEKNKDEIDRIKREAYGPTIIEYPAGDFRNE